MKFRSMILVLTIAFSAIFVSMLGTSYAYYVVGGSAKIEVTTGNIESGVAVIFEETDYINLNNAIPDSDWLLGDDYINTTTFKIIPNYDFLQGKEAAINIGITDIYIDNEFRKTNDFRLTLECDIEFPDGGIYVPEIPDITGTEFTNDVLSKDFLSLDSWNLKSINRGEVKEIYCSAGVWLKETDIDQNHLMNKNFRARIRVSTLFR